MFRTTRLAIACVAIALVAAVGCTVNPGRGDGPAPDAIPPRCPFDRTMTMVVGDSVATEWYRYMVWPQGITVFSTSYGGSGYTMTDLSVNMGQRVQRQIDACGTKLGNVFLSAGIADLAIGQRIEPLEAAVTSLSETCGSRASRRRGSPSRRSRTTTGPAATSETPTGSRSTPGSPPPGTSPAGSSTAVRVSPTRRGPRSSTPSTTSGWASCRRTTSTSATRATRPTPPASPPPSLRRHRLPAEHVGARGRPHRSEGGFARPADATSWPVGLSHEPRFCPCGADRRTGGEVGCVLRSTVADAASGRSTRLRTEGSSLPPN
jgi:hypothetical protein